jgi:MSHA biogenesis protein MshP
MMNTPRHVRPVQRGFGLIGAVIVLVIMSGIGVGILTLTTNQQTTSALDVQQSRALLAARSGLEWALFRWRAGGGGCANSAGTFTFPSGTTLSQFRVTVNCAQIAAGSTNILRLTSNACNGGAANCPVPGVPPSIDYVERELYADIPLAP